MGADCFKGRREIPDRPRMNEHSHIQRFYRVGVSGEKSPDTGELNIGLRAARIIKKDREFTRVNGKAKHPLDEITEDRVPSLAQVMAESAAGKRFVIPQTEGLPDANQPSETPLQRRLTQ